MTTADSIGMKNLSDALRGKINGRKRAPRFAGFAVFGGTRMLSVHDPKIVVPGITEIFPEMAKDSPGMVMLGMVPNFQSISRSKKRGLADKLILSVEEKKGVVTVIHPELRSVLLLQPTPDRIEPWDDEYKECFRLVKSLHDRQWKSLLVVYNGGNVTRREVELWQYWGQREPGRWNVLFIKESGRVADEFVDKLESDEGFRSENPDFHYADNTAESINAKLDELGAMVAPVMEEPLKKTTNVIPLRLVG
ncbi:MAG: hypothetical protein IAF58_17215 [Leptolyngbya sp.]|nr:hypothetical protein [Candidatus Melainabacteria bacterium]